MHLDKFYLDIIHFITAHYCFTRREDSAYWKAVKNETKIEPALQARLDVFRRYLPTNGTKGTAETGAAFRDLSWFCVLLGMNFDFEVPKPSSRALQAADAIARERRKRTKDLSSQLPNHYQHLSRVIYKQP
jgi:hypothetical protein